MTAALAAVAAEPLMPLAHAGHWAMALPVPTVVIGLFVMVQVERRRERRSEERPER